MYSSSWLASSVVPDYGSRAHAVCYVRTTSWTAVAAAAAGSEREKKEMSMIGVVEEEAKKFRRQSNRWMNPKEDDVDVGWMDGRTGRQAAGLAAGEMIASLVTYVAR